MAKGQDFWVGLDIGTTKVSAIVGSVVDDKRIEIVGIGTAPSNGLKKGMVVDIESTVSSIKRAISEAELMVDMEINTVYAGISGGHIKGINSRGVIAVKHREVSRTDLTRVIDAARAVPIPADREILHVLPQEFIIDGQDGIKDPMGMSGVRLEVDVHIITGAVTSSQNIVKCINRAGLEVEALILQPLASSEAVLTADEKELGVVMVDIGGGTTDIAIYSEGGLRHIAVLAIGGSHFTNDIAIGLRTPLAEAERIKVAHGCATPALVKGSEMVEVPGVGGRPPQRLSRGLLSEIIRPRAEEIFNLVAMEMEKAGHKEKVASGIVITGGCAGLDGMMEVAEKLLGLPVRRGLPTGIGGLLDISGNPTYATGVGLILHGYRNRVREDAGGHGKGQLVGRVASQMKSWLGEIF